jgi:hypothetical protein
MKEFKIFKQCWGLVGLCVVLMSSLVNSQVEAFEKANSLNTCNVITKTEPSKERDRSLVNPYYPFEWGDTIKTVQEKICGLPGIETVDGQSFDKFCSDCIKLDIKFNKPGEFIMSEYSSYTDSTYKYKDYEVVAGWGEEIEISPIIISGVKFKLTIKLNSLNKDFSAYVCDTQNNIIKHFSYNGKEYVLPFVMNSMELEILRNERDKAAVLGESLFEDLKKKYSNLNPKSYDGLIMTTIESKGTKLSYHYQPRSNRISIKYEGVNYLENKYRGVYEKYLESTIDIKKNESL